MRVMSTQSKRNLSEVAVANESKCFVAAATALEALELLERTDFFALVVERPDCNSRPFGELNSFTCSSLCIGVRQLGGK